MQKVSVALKQPYRCLYEFFHATEEMRGKYEGARKAWADGRMDEALEIADSVAPDKDEVARARLRVDVRANQAKAYHRDRWGDRVQVEKSVSVTVDQALLGTAGELLRLAQRKTEKLIEGAELVGEGSPPPSLPAARPPVERG